MNKLVVVIVILASAWNLNLYRPDNPQTIHIKGSDTMRILVDRLAEEYMKQRPGIAVFVEGGGTALGIRDLIHNRIDICTASRTIRPEEVRQLASHFNRIGINTRVAKDALSVYINPENPVRNLSMQQLEGIFTGKIKNWQAVGGNNARIEVIIRSPNSGTFLFFKEHVMGGKRYTPIAKTEPTTMAIIKAVLEDVNAIGYGGLAYGANVIHCKINQIQPSEKNVSNNRYPIIRYLYFYTIDTPRGNIKAFIDWVLKDGQQIVREVGYIPLWNE
jgi:phosphate transport system substrate-binding protein